MTPELQTAIAMALRKSYGYYKPGVIELTLQKNYRDCVIVRDFGMITYASPKKDLLSWAQFIVNNRNGIGYTREVAAKAGYEENNLDKRYDIVIGSIADGSVAKISRQCKTEKRLVTIEEAKEFLDKSFGIQYCISTEVGLSVISHPPREVKGVPLR